MKVGADVVVNNFGPKQIRGRKTKIMEIIKANGEISDIKTQFGWLPRSTLYLVGEEQFNENVYIYSWQSKRIIEHMKDFTNKTFRAGDYTPIEKICNVLSQIDTNAIVKNNDPEIKVIFPSRPYDPRHSCLDQKCSYITTVLYLRLYKVSNEYYTINYHVDDQVQNETINQPLEITYDPWMRSMFWMAQIMKCITDDPTSLRNIALKLRWAKFVRKEMYKIQQEIIQVIQRTPGLKSNPKILTEFPYITISINSFSLPVGVIGKYTHPTYQIGEEHIAYQDFVADPKTTIKFYGELTLHEAIFNNILKSGNLRKTGDQVHYYKYIIAHEMIHAIFREKCIDSNHGPAFKLIAQSIGLPEKYC